MSERSIEEMMEMLRESGETYPDFEKKSQEIINNFRDKKIQQFLSAFCLATESSPKKRLFQKKSENHVAKVLKYAYETMEQSEWEYFASMHTLLSKSDQFYKSFPERCGIGSIYQAYLDDKVILPNINEYQDLKKNTKYPALTMMPNIHLTELILHFQDALKGIAELAVDLPEENDSRWVEDERPSCFYAISLPEGKSSYDAFAKYRDEESSSPTKNDAFRQAEQKLLWPDGDSHGASVRGLTLREYIILQLGTLYSYDETRKILKHKPNTPKPSWLLDQHQKGVNNRALLLGWHKVSKDNKHEAYLAASWKRDYKEMVFESDQKEEYSYFPWFAVAFDESEEGSNE